MATDQPDPMSVPEPATAAAPETGGAAGGEAGGEAEGETGESAGKAGEPAADVKRRFREALAKKQERHTPHAAGVEGDSKLHGSAEPTGRRQFRRKSAP